MQLPPAKNPDSSTTEAPTNAKLAGRGGGGDLKIFDRGYRLAIPHLFLEGGKQFHLNPFQGLVVSPLPTAPSVPLCALHNRL